MKTDTDDSTIRWMVLACAVAGAALAFALRPAGAREGGMGVADAVIGAGAVAEAPAMVWSVDEVRRPGAWGSGASAGPAPRGRPVRHADVQGEPAAEAAARASATDDGRRVARACPPGEDRTRSVRMDDGRGVRRVEWADASCEVEVLIEGDVTFSADFTEFAAISPGGLVRISERGGGVDRLLEIRPGSGGGLEYSWRMSGLASPFDAEARSWLRGFVPELLRVSGIAAVERAAWLVRQQGADGLFGEVTQIRTDRVQRMYLEAWLGMGPHDPAEVARATEVAGAQLSSDRELAAVLLRVIDEAPIEGSLQDPFMSALGTIESDREYGRVASALLRAVGG